MDDLTRYVITYYGRLMTQKEALGYRSVLGHQTPRARQCPSCFYAWHDSGPRYGD